MSSVILVHTGMVVALMAATVQAQWQPAKGPLTTRWAKDVTPDKVHAEYPRPQMVRPDWQNLNGLWEYAIRAKDENRPQAFDGKILVPFPVESALSGVMKRVDEKQRLWYRRTFTVPADWAGRHVLLHFGAVDWETAVWVNGKQLGEHRGGYDPFTLDLTDALAKSGEQEIVLAVSDPTDAGTQPRGKQVRNPEGIWYTPTTGIWQTVWIEPVPQAHLDSLTVTPDLDKGVVRVQAVTTGEGETVRVQLEALAEGKSVAKAEGKPNRPIDMTIPKARLWSPDAPFLYDLKVELLDGAKGVDHIDGYFGMRKIAIGKDKAGITRILLNNEPLFQFGPLDQGFWPDGLYTAPTDEALRYDIEVLKKLGCNMARKHVKVEPDRWYYWCDKLGLLVWQDMPSGDAFPGEGKLEIERSKPSAEQYELELKRLIDAFGNHPSIVMWVPFNEGWGQCDTKGIAEWVKKYDPSRLVNSASGWNDVGAGDVHDIHDYPGPASPQPEAARAAVLGEFGGLGLPVAEHSWKTEGAWGYRKFKNSGELTDAFVNLIVALRPLINDPGLSAAVYTQTTDVEVEVNGLMTYDRAMMKVDADRAAAANRKLYLPPPAIKPIVPTSQEQGLPWRYTTEKPTEKWSESGFDDSAWREGPGGFGSKGTPGITVRTEWKTSDIWLRRSFDLAEPPAGPMLKLYHDEDAEVFINGRQAASAGGYTTGYTLLPLSDPAALKPGKNVLAVHCHQTGGGQGIDVGIVEINEAPLPSDSPAGKAGR